MRINIIHYKLLLILLSLVAASLVIAFYFIFNIRIFLLFMMAAIIININIAFLIFLISFDFYFKNNTCNFFEINENKWISIKKLKIDKIEYHTIFDISIFSEGKKFSSVSLPISFKKKNDLFFKNKIKENLPMNTRFQLLLLLDLILGILFVFLLIY